MRQPSTFIVRIYRHGLRRLSGVVENPRTGSRRPFSSIEELWQALGARAMKVPPVGQSRPGTPDKVEVIKEDI